MIHAVAPIRICDIGGWTDTWFAGHGMVLNIAVSPCASVRVAPGAGPEPVVMNVVDYGDRYGFDPRVPVTAPGRHPLLEAAVVALRPSEPVEISVHCDAPPGGSTGTSAAVTVALIGALDAWSSRGRSAGFVSGRSAGRMSPAEVAAVAHRVEVEGLGLQSGIQDQICSAFGGINLTEMTTYPESVVTPVEVPAAVWSALEDRLSLVYLGSAHQSSEVHEAVIAALAAEGPSSDRLSALRRLPLLARDALMASDLAAFGGVMIANTDAQAALHPALVGASAGAVIDVARNLGATGWKVNGAGGSGGSVTVLCGDQPGAKARFEAAVVAADPRFRVIPIALRGEGLQVWESPATT